MITISLIDARRGLSLKCRELFKDERIAEDIYKFLCDGIEDCENVQPQRMRGKWIGTEFDGYADGNPVYYEWKCSACGCVVEDEEPTWNYCPNCGCQMNGDEEDEQ